MPYDLKGKWHGTVQKATQIETFPFDSTHTLWFCIDDKICQIGLIKLTLLFTLGDGV